MKFRRTLALALSFLLLIPCLGVCEASAASESPKYEQEGFTYVCFGDSFTRGMGCSDNWEEETELDYGWYDHQSRNVTGAYPYIVATELGCDTVTDNGYLDEPDATYWPLIQNGQRVAGVLDFFGVEDNYYDSYFYHDPDRGHARRYDKFVKYFGNPDSTYPTEGSTYGEYGSVYDARELVESADLITVQLGMADVFNRPVFAAAQEYLGGDLNFNDADTETIAKFAARVVENMYEGYDYFVEAYPKLVEYLKGLTENGKNGSIVLLTVANPAFGLNLSDEVLLPIGTAFSAISILVNEHIRQCAEEYGVLCVDISNVDTSSNEYDWSLDDMFDGKAEIGTHPSPNGHKQIARMIIDAYRNQNKPVTTDIVLDLGRFSSIDYVMLDGKILSAEDYSVKDNVLTVKSTSVFHKSLTIAVKKSAFDLAVSVYSLSYDSDNGYAAYRLYTTNSVVSVAKSAVNIGKAAVNKIVSGLSNLLK